MIKKNSGQFLFRPTENSTMAAPRCALARLHPWLFGHLRESREPYLHQWHYSPIRTFASSMSILQTLLSIQSFRGFIFVFLTRWFNRMGCRPTPNLEVQGFWFWSCLLRGYRALSCPFAVGQHFRALSCPFAVGQLFRALSCPFAVGQLFRALSCPFA